MLFLLFYLAAFSTIKSPWRWNQTKWNNIWKHNMTDRWGISGPLWGCYPTGNVSMNCHDKMIRSCFQLSVSLSALRLKYKERTLNLWFNTSEIIDPGHKIILLDRKYWNKLFSLEMICNKWKMAGIFWANNSGSDSLKWSHELIFAFTLKNKGQDRRGSNALIYLSRFINEMKICSSIMLHNK